MPSLIEFLQASYAGLLMPLALSILAIPTQSCYTALLIKKDEKEVDENLVGKSADVFIEYYNQNIPDSFPSATEKNLEEFQTQYPSLFKNGSKWVINKHRKKFMDWLTSHHDKK